MKKYLITTLFIIAFYVLNAQDDCYQLFRSSGLEKFNQSKYKEAINNYAVANDCEDKPIENNILVLIKNAENCLNFRKQADSLFKINKFQISKYLYNQVLELNSKDEYCLNQIKICDEKIACFEQFRSLGLSQFKQAKYNSAIQTFKNTEDCPEKPQYSDIDLHIQNAEICIKSIQKADSAFAIKNYSLANQEYDKVLAVNPFDQHSIEQKKHIPSPLMQFITKPIRKTKYITTNLHFRYVGNFAKAKKIEMCMVGLTYGKTGNWGYYINFAFGETKTHSSYEFNSMHYISKLSDNAYLNIDEQAYTEVLKTKNIFGENYDVKDNAFSITFGTSKQMIRRKFFRMHLYSGLGIATWGEIKENVGQNRYKQTPRNSNWRYIINDNTLKLVEVSEYWIETPENLEVAYFTDEIVFDLGFIFQIYRYTFTIGTSILSSFDSKVAESYNQSFVFGIGYAF